MTVCRNCGTEIVFDGEYWWHADVAPVDSECYDGTRGPEPETFHGEPIRQ